MSWSLLHRDGGVGLDGGYSISGVGFPKVVVASS